MTSTVAAPATRPVAVDELKRAWQAVTAGTFRPPTGRRATGDQGAAAGEWLRSGDEHTVAIVGCVGSGGASTIALSAALAAPGPVRVIECSSATASGLAAAATAELGIDPSGWSQGRRDHVLLQRASHLLATIEEVPQPPTAESGTLTFLDVGWEAGQLHAGASWLTRAVTDADLLVLVTTATTPGMRRLAVALDLLAPSTLSHQPVVVAVHGPRRRKWSKGVEADAGPRLQQLLGDGALVEIPQCREIAITGLDSRPVPRGLVEAARRLLDHLPPRSSSELAQGSPPVSSNP